jgi:protein PhnA
LARPRTSILPPGLTDSGEENYRKEPIMSDDIIVKDSNGNILGNGDSVTLIKDLKVKGTSVTLKRGTLVKNIRLTDDAEEIECNADKVKGLVLKTCFLKKA